MSSGSVWYGLPMVRIEDILDMKNRIVALEAWCNTLEALLLAHRRDAAAHYSPFHVKPEAPAHDSPIYYQTLIDSATPEAGVGPLADHRGAEPGSERDYRD